MRQVAVLLVALLTSQITVASETASPADTDNWFDEDIESKTARVSEGELRFLSAPAGKPLLHSINALYIDTNSIASGWVKLQQCYRHLDAVANAEVVYQYRQIQNLRLDTYKDIAKARVVGQSVQLEQVGKQAELCVRAEVRIFYQNPDGSFSLVNGPFHRKFLDGYYPYHVTLNIHYPGDLLELQRTQPSAQAGFAVTRLPGQVQLDSYFEGILHTETVFRLIAGTSTKP